MGKGQRAEGGSLLVLIQLASVGGPHVYPAFNVKELTFPSPNLPPKYPLHYTDGKLRLSAPGSLAPSLSISEWQKGCCTLVDPQVFAKQ